MELTVLKNSLKEHKQCQGRFFLPLDREIGGLKVKQIEETKKAVRLEIKKGDKYKRNWFPKSQLNFIVIKNMFIISFKNWLAEKTIKDYVLSLDTVNH